MNDIISFKKDVIFKTSIASITNISLTHDYKIEEDMINGTLFLEGTYKMTEASTINEEFYYDIPFSIAISDRINKDTLLLEIEKFDYSYKEDTLSIIANLNMKYEENILNDINEDIPKETLEEKIYELKKDIKEKKKTLVDELIDEVNEKTDFITYKVHIVRKDDTFESIASKYDVNVNLIKEYNNVDEINIGDKILVPYVYNE